MADVRSLPFFAQKKRPKPGGLRDINQGASTSYLYSWLGASSGEKFSLMAGSPDNSENRISRLDFASITVP